MTCAEQSACGSRHSATYQLKAQVICDWSVGATLQVLNLLQIEVMMHCQHNYLDTGLEHSQAATNRPADAHSETQDRPS